MSIQLIRASYEQMIKQLIYIDENRKDITDTLLANKLFLSKSGAHKYLKGYVHAVEAILADISVVEQICDFSGMRNGFLPFVIIDSDVTLTDKNSEAYCCHLTSNIYEQSSGSARMIYAFSESGLELLLKENDATCIMDIGKGYGEYTIHSVKV